LQDVACLRLGIVVERRQVDHPWQDHDWRPVAVLPGVAPLEDWRLIAEGPGFARYLAASLELELYPRETEGYRLNLTSAEPVVYVLLRRREAGEGHEIEAFHVTVSPEEAQDYLDSDSEIVEGVPMPPLVRALVEDFVARHPSDAPFEKRQRKPWSEGEPDRRLLAGRSGRRGGGRR
jgi:Protein of unknown function (DUF3305)